MSTLARYQQGRLNYLFEHLNSPHGLLNASEEAEIREEVERTEIDSVLSNLEWTHTQDHTNHEHADEFTNHEHADEAEHSY